MLRDEIVHGVIRPGTHLGQESLCKRFGTSRVPIRDALQQLQSEGLLIQRAGRREVVELGEDSLFDAQTLLAVLHGWAAHQAAELATEEELQQLAALAEYMFEAEDPLDFGQRTVPFHRHINRYAHSPRLIEVIRTLERTVPRVVPLSFPDRLLEIKKRYEPIISAILRRDAAVAEMLVRSLSMDLAAWVADAAFHNDGASQGGQTTE